jgi:hypothetical protein
MYYMGRVRYQERFDNTEYYIKASPISTLNLRCNTPNPSHVEAGHSREVCIEK